jgi:hypothetical protein
MAFGLVAALAAGGWAIASQPVTTVAQQEPTHEPSTGSGTATATNLAPSWNEEVTGTNADRFDQWLRDHEGQVVRIDATLDGYWEDAGTTFSLQDPESLALTSTVTFVPSSSGRPGFEGGAGSYAGLSGYYAVNPSYFASTGGWRHSLQALDTVEALNLLRNEPARSVPTATATATPATPTNPSTPTPQAQTAAPGLVSPPTVDSLRIGMTIQQAEQTGGAHWDPNYWGEGSGALAATSDWYSLSDNGITLTGIAINGSYWATPEGISVGSSVSDLYSAYPGLHPSEADPAVHLIWNGDWGYQFFVTDGTVSNIAFGTGYGQSAVYD